MKRAYYKLVSLFHRQKPVLHEFDFADFTMKIKEEDLDIPIPRLKKLNPSYVFVHSLASKPEVTVNRLYDFRTQVKHRVMTFNYPVIFRNYPLGFSPEIKEFNTPELALKLPPKVNSIGDNDIAFTRSLRMYEEIVKVVPYVRKVDKKRLFALPIIKQPLYKNTFSREQMKILREKTAQQNNTGWANIQIFEIYDKFCPGLYSNVKQESGSKNIECALSITTAGRKPDKAYYLVIGQRKDTRQPIKAIIESADIKPE